MTCLACGAVHHAVILQPAARSQACEERQAQHKAASGCTAVRCRRELLHAIKGGWVQQDSSHKAARYTLGWALAVQQETVSRVLGMPNE